MAWCIYRKEQSAHCRPTPNVSNWNSMLGSFSFPIMGHIIVVSENAGRKTVKTRYE
jgi:hypothetical protein